MVSDKQVISTKGGITHSLKCLTLLLQVSYLHDMWQSVAGMIISGAWDDSKVNLFYSGDSVAWIAKHGCKD
jgi:hypothetical protein